MNARDPNFKQVMDDIALATRPLRYEWEVTTGPYKFNGVSTAYSASECIEEAAITVMDNELSEMEVWDDVVVRVKFRK